MKLSVAEEDRTAMTTPGSPTVRRRRLAAELRAIREGTNKSGDVVAHALKWSPSKISRYELARTGLKVQEVEKLLDYYQVTGSFREKLLALAEDAAQRGWWEDYADTLSPDYQQFIGLEHEATSIAIWHVALVTGLFQTEDYARNVIGSYSSIEPVPRGTVERLVRVRKKRQELLVRQPPVTISLVLDESVLRRRVGDAQVMHDQLKRLADDADRPNVTLRILPFDTRHKVFAESFVIFSFGPDEGALYPDVVSSEHLKNVFSLEGERETHIHRIVFQTLESSALDPDASKALIRDIADGYAAGA
jgi:transcriptional regulator with XRE-family HTH domain